MWKILLRFVEILVVITHALTSKLLENGDLGLHTTSNTISSTQPQAAQRIPSKNGWRLASLSSNARKVRCRSRKNWRIGWTSKKRWPAGCFFFEVELKEGCILPQVGLAGDQFIWKVGVKSVMGIGGIGDDEYSCSVDGLHGACLKNGPVSSWSVRWPKSSVEKVHFDCEEAERERAEILGKTLVVGTLEKRWTFCWSFFMFLLRDETWKWDLK